MRLASPVGVREPSLEAYWQRSCGGSGWGLLVSLTEKRKFVVCVGEKGNVTTVRRRTCSIRRCNVGFFISLA
jgi:hypothetical protein